MKKLFITFLIALVPFFCIGQAPQTIGTRFNTVEALGKFQADTGLKIPIVLKANAIEGSVAYSMATHSMYIKTNSGWVEIPTGTAATGVYTGASPTTVTVGGLGAGTDINGMTFQAILEAILVPYQSPYFASFGITGQTTSVEIGTTISGTKSFAWSIGNNANVTNNTLDIIGITNSNTLATNISNVSPASYAIGTITNNSPATYTWRVSADATNNIPFTADYTINWLYSIYSGQCVGTTPTNSEILANYAQLSTTRSRSSFTIPITGTDKHFYLASPVSFGHLTSILVGIFESLPAMTETTQTITNAHGVAVSYYVYTSQNTFSTNVDQITAN